MERLRHSALPMETLLDSQLLQCETALDGLPRLPPNLYVINLINLINPLYIYRCLALAALEKNLLH